MTVRDSITRARARTPGAEATPPPRRCTNEPSSRHSAGLPRSPRSARKADTNHHQPVYAGSRLKPADVREGAALHASLPADDLPPSLHEHYTRFGTTTGQSAPLRRIGTFGLAVGAACALYGAFLVKEFRHAGAPPSSVSLLIRKPFLRPDPRFAHVVARRSCQRLAVAPT